MAWHKASDLTWTRPPWATHQRETIADPDAHLTEQQKRLFSDIRQLESDLAKRDPEEKAAFREKALYEISLRFHNSNRAMLDELEKQAARHKADWLKEHEADPAKLLLEAHRWESRYTAMDAAKLDAEIDDYTQGADFSRDRVDALGAAAARVKGEPDATLEVAKVRRNYAAPWRNQRPEFYKALQLYSSEFGTVSVLGADGIETIEISEILQD